MFLFLNRQGRAARSYRRMSSTASILGLLLTSLTGVAFADPGDVVTVKRLGMPLAAKIAEKAVNVCQERGYNVSAVVVDRAGDPQVVMRGTDANRFTVQVATDKARSVILSGVDSSVFRRNRQDIRMEMDHVDGILMLDGGVRIDSAGTLIGALGVSGAPGGDKDEACAKAAVQAFVGRLDLP
ncbi:MAG: hypothetical protein B7X28_02150 [Halothiobacillus sp. 13-55-253]|nr:MAG: hypothetical protein B7X28_02150 [Halothiobacillus sp. 13-55-253]